MHVKTFLPLLLLAVTLMNTTVMSQNKTYKTRDEVPAEFKWNLNDIYPDWKTWEEDFEEVKNLMDELASMKGKVSESKDNLKETLKKQTMLSKKAIRLYSYPHLMKAVESSNPEVSQRLQQAQYLFAMYSTKMSWITPELLTIPKEKMMDWIDSDSELADYKFSMEKMYHSQEHVLSEDMEALLSYFTQVNNAPSTIYSELANSDMNYKEVELSDGTKLKATPGASKQVLSFNKNQDDRRKVSKALYDVYDENKHAYAAIYNAVCQSDWASAQARKYESTLDSYLHGKNIPKEVYLNLVETVKENTEPLQRYAKMRAKVLGLEGNYHRYDGALSLADSDKLYPYEEAREHIKASVAPLGDDYSSKLSTAMSEGWLDVYEYEGKRPGAFSSGVYGVHPYMLLNYSATMGDMFTLSHELGHTMHTLLADENQPYPTHGYTIFVAEVASTFNERLLLDYMMEKSEDPKERIELLTQAIDNITGTFYMQTLFADYELQVHQMVEQGKPVTADVLSGIFRGLVDKYYGDAVINDDFYDVIWARIHHFYGMPYYVYQYATSYAASAKLYENIMNSDDKEKAFANYLELLKAGGNDYPVNQLKKAGVDMTQPESVTAVISQLDELINQLEKELEKI